ncbi:uncharacterized protein LOC141533726 [Cotesia typhae]|uniref:uncharacterized protein LOC141533726 n=1 Tax=Cotesia typhae TaxID=2053667 RepID=UPI003D69BE74
MKAIAIFILIFIWSVLVTAEEKEEEEEWDSRHFNGHQWFVNFNSCNKDCLVVPVKPKIFLADAECINSFADELNQNQNWINWESVYGSRFPSIATFDGRNISFHEDMSEEYDLSRRKVAVIISNQPCVPFSIKSRILKMAFSLYTKRSLYYNKRYQILHINKNIEDIDFNNCSIPIFGSYRNVSVGPCLPSEDKNTLLCSYNPTEFLCEVMYESPTITLFCNSIENPEKAFLAGLIQKEFLLEDNQESTISMLEVINVSDMWKVIDEKWKELYPTAPEESKEFGPIK